MTTATRIARRRATTPALTGPCLSTVRSGRPPRRPFSAGPEGHAQRQQLSEVWFSATYPHHGLELPDRGRKRPDERTLKLGKTLRILQERLPTLLQSPLPSEILSPTISLHLFPSTHPHLPAVSGRVAYVAALWTSPLAWNRVPIVGNVRLEILSERMSKQPLLASPRRAGAGDEELVVRWRTIGAASAGDDKTKTTTTTTTTTTDAASTTTTNTNPLLAGDPTKEFTGLFIFEFDQEGRVLSHTIEHVEEGGNWERSVGARFVGLTDWLLGGMRGGSQPPVAAFELQQPHRLR
ncbi:hypothetical protein CMQ_3725 [Grosmannia clavigera kw1407]|uniref:Chromosome transmission fidelity protein 4 n=1 Tax=Grosmannia clavigera (strain kw1407 / UAMH 11150) TaxID=655863 RepID=F0XA57_GROCL|nr:uncharacterized protein CMQ_3725 [Grosmannia clavigera kw1407]EFX05656.1 hypothetical protein CMQ_3725 [Grosmannia clavigera kw1407]